MKALLLNATLSLFSALLCLGGIEIVLYAAGYQAEQGKRFTYVPNRKYYFDNIEYHYGFKSNSLGFRDVEPAADDEETLSLVVLGDSFANGQGVGNHDRFSDLLKTRLERTLSQSSSVRKVQVQNAAIPATGPIQYLRSYLHLRNTLKPDFLLVCIFANDLINTPLAFNSHSLEKLPEYQAPGGTLVQFLFSFIPRTISLAIIGKRGIALRLQDEDDFFASTEAQAREQGVSEARIAEWRSLVPDKLARAAAQRKFNDLWLRAGLLRPGMYLEGLAFSSPTSTKRQEHFRTILQRLFSLARQDGAVPLLVYIPMVQQVYEHPHISQTLGLEFEDSWVRTDTEFQTFLARLSLDEKVQFLDSTQQLRDTQDTALYFPLDTHLNERGHAALAAILHPWIVRQLAQRAERTG